MPKSHNRMIIDANFLENLSNDLKRIVLDASEAIIHVYEKNTFDTEIKSDGSPVTEADENANKIIIQSLNIISPDISIVSEETYDKSDEIPKTLLVSRSFRWDQRIY
jgi:3'-phosphoadenosine 5'-phosphosulfate (PAPS) 3'-phosphatase